MICLKLRFLKIIKNIFKENFRWVRVLVVAYISYNTGTRALPDIYALILGRYAPSDIVHIYQAMHSCLCYNLYMYIVIVMNSRDQYEIIELCKISYSVKQPR